MKRTTTRSKTTARRSSSSTKTSAKTFFALGLGANLGPAEAALAAAIQQLEHALGPIRSGGLYRTRPHSPIPQPPYLNTAVVGQTTWSPAALLRLAKELEARAGRRPGPRLGPRELDIDILLYGTEVLNQPDLTLPHPRLRQRRFVLAPLADIAPLAIVPPDGTTVQELLARVGQEDEVERLGW